MFSWTLLFGLSVSVGADVIDVPALPAVESVDSVKSKLLSDLTSSFRRGHDEGRLVEFEDGLQPMFAALPKNVNNNLGHFTARYALHRYFIEKHGWSIEGLAPVDLEREATPMSSLSQWMPDYLVDSVEHILGTDGVNLRELAVIAAVFEDLVHREASKRLEEVYETLKLPTTGVLHEVDSFDAIKAYMTMYTSGGNTTVRSTTDLLQKKGGLNRRTKLWLKDVQSKVAEAESICDDSTGDCGRLDFKAAVRVVEEIGEQYRSFNEHECEDLINTLEQSADKPGKVGLSDFYAEGLHGSWNFTETPEYLRALGALEEGGSDDSESHVLIPNYVASRPNCLATSSIYVVCCRNQCESMMSQLESAIAGAVAEPHQILKILSITSSDAISRLGAIAGQHDSQVPLHGHAFANWLHEVYPRFCPRPHAAGVSHVLSLEERALETGVMVATEDITVVDLPVSADAHSSVSSVMAEPDIRQIEQTATQSNHQFVAFVWLFVCSCAVAIWASNGVLFDAEGFMYLNQLTGSNKIQRDHKHVLMPTCRIISLSLSLVAIVFSFDVLMCEMWSASSGDLVLGALTVIGFAASALVARENMVSQFRKRIELPVV